MAKYGKTFVFPCRYGGFGEMPNGRLQLDLDVKGQQAVPTPKRRRSPYDMCVHTFLSC